MTERRANRHRGEIEAMFGGERHVLCLTLGALAELETAFGAEDLAALGARLGQGRLAAIDIVRIVGAGLRGAGTTMSDAEVAGLPVNGDLGVYAGCVVALLTAAFGIPEALVPDEPVPETAANP